MRAALLDDDDVFLGMVTLAEGVQPGPQHLPQIDDCDLPPRRYRWVRHDRNAFGGEFVPIAPTAVRPAEDLPALEEVVALLILKPDDARLTKWAAWYRKTMDAQGRGV